MDGIITWTEFIQLRLIIFIRIGVSGYLFYVVRLIAIESNQSRATDVGCKGIFGDVILFFFLHYDLRHGKITINHMVFNVPPDYENSKMRKFIFPITP